jgi:hypothetical protein
MAKSKHIAIFTESPAKLAEFYTEVSTATASIFRPACARSTRR